MRPKGGQKQPKEAKSTHHGAEKALDGLLKFQNRRQREPRGGPKEAKSTQREPKDSPKATQKDAKELQNQLKNQ